MELPELPTKYNRKESKVDGRVATWFFDHWPKSILLEVKVEKGKVTPHQQRLIDQMAETGNMQYKFPDGARRTPLDYVVLKNADVALCTVYDDNTCICEINKEQKIKIDI